MNVRGQSRRRFLGGAGLGLVAGSGWIIDAVCLLALSRFAPVGLANLASSSLAATFVYLVAHRYVHDGRAGLVGLRLGAYVAYTLVVILAASAALAAVAAAIHAYVEAPLRLICAKVLITPPQFVCNFLMSRLIARARLGRG